jgi:hypothetical protein
MAWRPISEAPGKHPIVIRDKRSYLPGGTVKSRVGLLISGGRCILYSATRVAEPEEVARLEWNDLGKTIEGPTLRCSKPYTNCDTAGPVYSPEWFSEDCDLRAEFGAAKPVANSAGDYPIDFVPEDVDRAKLVPPDTPIVSRPPKCGRGRPKGSKNKQPRKLSDDPAKRPGRKPGKNLSESTKYFTPLIAEMRAAGKTYPQIVESLNSTRHPHKVPGIEMTKWLMHSENKRRKAAENAAPETYEAGGVKLVGGLFGMADNATTAQL